MSGGNESWVKDEDPMAASPAWDPVPSQWGHSKAEEQLCGRPKSDGQLSDRQIKGKDV